jgi:hypothetical protein
MKLHLPGRSHPEPVVHAEPGKPHAFVRIDDPGMGVMAAGGAGRISGGGVNVGVALTDNHIRKSRCGLAGCGRERNDEIHAAAED